MISPPSVYRNLAGGERATLLDILDRLLDMGVVVDGSVLIRLADVDLVTLRLKLFLSSIERAEAGTSGEGRAQRPVTGNTRERDQEYIARLEEELRKAEQVLPRAIDAADPKSAEKGIAKLVLTLVELIRKLMERQARRRVEGGRLSEAEVEKLGLTLEALERKMAELKRVFGITDEDLNIDLGPVGNLI